MKFQKGKKRPENAGIKKGTKQPKTILKEQLGKTLFEQTAEQVDRNMNEFINSPDEQTRLIATKYFGKFFRAEKKELSGNADNPITFQIKVDKFI